MVNSTGHIYRRVNNQWGDPLPGLARDIGIGADGSVWVIGTHRLDPPNDHDYGVLRWNESERDWHDIDGGGVRIAVDPNGNPWVVNSTSHIYRRVNNQWGDQLPDRALDIGIGADGSVWMIGHDPVGQLPANPGTCDWGIHRWTGSA